MKLKGLVPGDMIRWRWPDVAKRHDDYFVVVKRDKYFLEVFNIKSQTFETLSAKDSFLVMYGELV